MEYINIQTPLVLLALFLFLLFAAFRSVKIVPQSQQWIITRMGAQHRVLKAGVNFIVPFLDRVHQKVSVADQVRNDIKLDVVSSDNVVFSVDLLVVFKVQKPEESVFRVDSIDNLVIGLVRSLARAEIGKYDLDSLQSDRTKLNDAIRESLSQAGEDYGVLISRAEIIDVKLQESTQRAMAEVLEAERSRRATVTRATGEKSAVELRAQALLYEEQKRAEAILVIARATAEANELIGKAIQEYGKDAAGFQIAQAQIDAIKELSKSSNSKIIMVPGDVSYGMTRAAAMLMAKEG